MWHLNNENTVLKPYSVVQILCILTLKPLPKYKTPF